MWRVPVPTGSPKENMKGASTRWFTQSVKATYGETFDVSDSPAVRQGNNNHSLATEQLPMARFSWAPVARLRSQALEHRKGHVSTLVSAPCFSEVPVTKQASS